MMVQDQKLQQVNLQAKLHLQLVSPCASLNIARWLRSDSEVGSFEATAANLPRYSAAQFTMLKSA